MCSQKAAASTSDTMHFLNVVSPRKKSAVAKSSGQSTGIACHSIFASRWLYILQGFDGTTCRRVWHLPLVEIKIIMQYMSHVHTCYKNLCSPYAIEHRIFQKTGSTTGTHVLVWTVEILAPKRWLKDFSKVWKSRSIFALWAPPAPRCAILQTMSFGVTCPPRFKHQSTAEDADSCTYSCTNCSSMLMSWCSPRCFGQSPIYTQLLIRWWYSWTIIGPHPLQNKKNAGHIWCQRHLWSTRFARCKIADKQFIEGFSFNLLFRCPCLPSKNMRWLIW